MALITAQPIVLTGLAPVLTTPSASDTVAGGDSVFLWIKTTGTATTLTVPGQVASNFGQVSPTTDLVVVCPSTGDRFIGPLNANRGLISPTTGLCTLNYSGALTGVTAGAFLF